MDTDLRSSLVAAGAAFALSSLTGLVSGVAFGALIGRALVIGLVFGALAFGALYLIRSFNMGTQPHGSEARMQEPQSELGHSVDIVLDEEGPEGMEDAILAEDAPFRAGERDRYAEAESPEIARVTATSHASARPAAAMHGSEQSAPEEIGSLLDEEEAEEASPVPSPHFTASAGSSDGFDDLDVLPDLEGFSDSFAAPEYRNSSRSESAGASGARSPGSGAGDAEGLGGRAGLDPATLAQAVRTILKRDQKG